ncbi:16068_t:CDS:2 [Cetraspora pellucida]|uniref:16068_t:CDS:1 n=1 Tax=Cetraspora pellucida TaxID=1433469 RepID=A0A9N9BJ22_9GLOM|nr:16068_t:CDS:2 [Cetraspora pellucida]
MQKERRPNKKHQHELNENIQRVEYLIINANNPFNIAVYNEFSVRAKKRNKPE